MHDDMSFFSILSAELDQIIKFLIFKITKYYVSGF